MVLRLVVWVLLYTEVGLAVLIVCLFATRRYFVELICLHGLYVLAGVVISLRLGGVVGLLVCLFVWGAV